MGREKAVRTLAFSLLLNLYFFMTPAINLGQQARFWQVFFQLQVLGEYRNLTAEIEGNYFLEVEWLAFLEEDDLDFIIYHLGAYPSCWELAEKTPEGIFTNSINRGTKNNKILDLPPPEFRLEYIQGEEKEIIFYFSLRNLPIPVSKNHSLPEAKLFFPSVPWKQNVDEESRMKKKITGQKIISLPRSKLESNECQERFSWTEEITTPITDRISFHQKHRARVCLRLVRCDLKP